MKPDRLERAYDERMDYSFYLYTLAGGVNFGWTLQFRIHMLLCILKFLLSGQVNLVFLLIVIVQEHVYFNFI